MSTKLKLTANESWKGLLCFMFGLAALPATIASYCEWSGVCGAR